MIPYSQKNNENILITLERNYIILYIVYEKIKGTYKGTRVRNFV